MSYLLDTNILSETYKPRPDPRFLKWMSDVDSKLLHICAISIGEIRRGIEMKRLQYAEAAARLEETLIVMERLYGARIWSLNTQAAHLWGKLMVRQPQHPIDMQIAAIALANNAIVVTRNVKDFKALDIQLINPFDET